MSQILLLDDRPGRQEQYLGSKMREKLKDLKELTTLLGEQCREMINKLNSKDDSNLEEFTLIIIHRSALSIDGINTVKEHCKKKKKNLVFFSGGISQSLYSSQDFQYMLLNSKDLYQPNLYNFLSKYVEGQVEHITELLYGDNWKLNLMLNYRQLLIKGKLSRTEENVKENIEKLIEKRLLEDINLNKEIEAKIAKL
jgi:hypothetical protein